MARTIITLVVEKMHPNSYLNRTALLACAGIAAALLASEALLRETRFRGYAPALAFARGYHIPSAATIFSIAPNYPTTTHYAVDVVYDIWSNEYGCFDTSFEAGTPYIYLTGDSFTWGFAPFADTWGTRLEGWLPVRVAKCGVAGFGTGQELRKTAHDIARMGDPRLIIVGLTTTDVGDDAWFAERLRTGAPPNPLPRWPCGSRTPTTISAYAACWLKRHSVLYNVLWRLAPTRPAEDDFEVHGWQPIETNIRSFQTLARDHGAKPLFVLIPLRGEVIQKTSPLPAWGGIQSILQRNGIAYLDLLPAFQTFNDNGRTPLYWPHDAHLNIAGNHLTGALVAEYLLHNDLVRIENKEAVLGAIRDTIARFEQQYGNRDRE